MNAPLTPDERTAIEAAIARTERMWGGGHKELVRAMEAEAYWRERSAELEARILDLEMKDADE